MHTHIARLILIRFSVLCNKVSCFASELVPFVMASLLIQVTSCLHSDMLLAGVSCVCTSSQSIGKILLIFLIRCCIPEICPLICPVVCQILCRLCFEKGVFVIATDTHQTL